MRRLSVRWILLGVAAVSLLIPAMALVSLRSFDEVLVRQTERELGAQGVVIGAHFREAWADAYGVRSGESRDRWHQSNSFIPLPALVQDIDRLSSPIPEQLPARPSGLTSEERFLSERLSRALRNAQVHNLSGVRILAPDGCAIASSRGQIGSCFTQLPEVRRALRGQVAAALRKRVSDEPTPPLTSLRRRGDVRVFLAEPVWNEGEVIGVVLLSRTAESGLEWLFKRRKGIFWGGTFVLAVIAFTIFAFGWFITRPLAEMGKVLDGRHSHFERLTDVRAPREIHALGALLDERARRLEEKNAYIAEFAANVSHELKTPLTSIRGAVELLQDAGEQMDIAQRERFFANILEAVQRTERLVTKLLVLARLESPEAEDTSDSICLDRYAAALEARYGDLVRVSLEENLKSTEIGEETLEAAVGNVVENALRYRRKRAVQVEFKRAHRDHRARIHVAVSDDGPGISPQNQARIFDRFFTTERDLGGTGLGLAIVRATVERRGGRVSVSSDAEGTRVEMWL